MLAWRPVVEMGAAHGIACPACEGLTRMFHEIEDGARAMVDGNLVELMLAKTKP